MLYRDCQGLPAIFGGVYKTLPRIVVFHRNIAQTEIRIIFLYLQSTASFPDSAEETALLLFVLVLAFAAALVDDNIHENHIVADAHDFAPRDDHFFGLGQPERLTVADDQRNDAPLAGLELDVGDKAEVGAVPHIDDILLSEACRGTAFRKITSCLLICIAKSMFFCYNQCKKEVSPMSVCEKVTDLDAVRAALPKRPADANKATFGRVLLVCGSDDMRGCAALAVLGALRCGAGLVTLASTRAVIDTVSAAVFEATYLDRAAGDLFAAAAKANAVGYGCGLGQSAEVGETLRRLLATPGAPLVIDADGLNALAADPGVLRRAARPVVLTPHPLEFARLCGRTVADIQADRAAAAVEFAKTYFSPAVGGVLLLKGAGTIITDSETVLRNPTGSSALSKGGTGDTLCGMVCAFLAEGAKPLDAAMLAAYVHGLAGERAAEVYSDYGVLARDVSAFAAKVLREITK